MLDIVRDTNRSEVEVYRASGLRGSPTHAASGLQLFLWSEVFWKAPTKAEPSRLYTVFRRALLFRKPLVDPNWPRSASTSGNWRPSHPEPLPRNPQARLIARTVFTILLVLLALFVSRSFLPALAWAAIIAITAWPVYARFAGVISRNHAAVLAPLLFTLLTGLLVFLPIALAAQQAAEEGDRLLQWLTGLRETGVTIPEWLVQLPIAGGFAARWWQANLADPAGARALLGIFNEDSLAAWIQALGGELIYRLFFFLVALLALFVLLRDGPWLTGRVLGTADRVLGDPGERLASKMVEAVRGTVNGTVVVAVTEGALIGVGYLLAGVPNAFLFALLTMAFALLPLGAWVAFSVAALVLLVQGGSALAAACVFAWGALVMLIGDYFVWPALVGSAARLPFLLALVGIFGGLQTFGLIGLFIGPVIMAALLTIWREWLMPGTR